MNKNDLIAAVSEKTGLSKNDTTKTVDGVLETIENQLKQGGDVRLVGFGTFSVSNRAASEGRILEQEKKFKSQLLNNLSLRLERD